MEQFKDAYEISLWEDVPVAASGSGNNEIPAHYEEEKIGVIGSDTMTAQWRAIEPRLTQNVNGTNTFSFKMFYTYIDTITGERKDNPFKTLLVNERKVKVKWKNDWYDFVIKNINEDSSGKSCTYTCQDQFINELSKNGFNLEFDNELGNNMGTAQELAETVLDGTDWSVGLGEPIKQYREEPVYDISDTWIDEQQVRHNIRFLVFYSVVQNHATDFQYWYDSSNQYTRDGTSMLVVNGECKSATASWNEDTATVTIEGHSMDIDFAPLNVSDNYRAKRLVKSQETAFCPPLDRYVLKYKKDGDTYYGYETTSYTDPTLVTDYIVNGRAFTSTQGWTGADWNVYPSYSTGAENVTSYLIIPKGSWVQNSTLYDYRYGRFKNGLTKGEKLVLRVKAKVGTEEAPSNTFITSGLNIRVSSTNSGGTNYITSSRHSYGNGWINYVLTCNESCAYDNLISDTSVTLRFSYSNSNNTVTHLWIEEIQFFDYTVNASGKLLIPSEYDIDGVVKTEWRYFPAEYLAASSEEDVVFSDYSDTPNSDYNPVYPEGNNVGEKIRSITGKNSNRFNWIQTIAETFECWAKFYIEHNSETGELVYYNGVPHKEVTFVEEVGDNTGLSFVYGIDLNTISRTINSDQIATKVIVSPNSNEFGQDGFCTIARSSENYSKTNFILDFGYYINQGMLSSGEVNRDLYDSSDSGNGIGYYYWLRQLNTEYDQITDKIVDLKAQLDRYNSALDNYTKLCDSTTKEINSVQTRLMGYAGLTGTFNKTKVYNYVKNHEDYQAVQTLWDTLTRLNTELPKYQETKDQIDAQVTKLNNDIETKEISQKTIEGNIKELDEKFYKKYARFIQEGSWISEDYYDDNLYYLDAESVAYTSSRPQIQYNINVLRLSALDEFKNKIFNVGDKAYIEDTEFFGYLDDRITPYKEEVIISEITSVFDSPEQDTITVQNYKTQFEDLFQRITATTQSLQYASGAYNRAASIVEPTGEINSWTLEKSLVYNEQLAWRATDDSVVINATGITTVDTTNPQNMVRLSSAGLQISDDGGVTWTVGVSGAGISTQNLTAGSINVDNIQILSGSYKTFTWNKYGINAYYYETDQGGNINVNSNTFVRFDRYGLYGINNIGEDGAEYKPESESQIWEDANFAVTWKGFKLKTDTGAVTITSEDDISVWDNQQTPINRIKIGRLSGQGTSGDPYVYGIRINNSNGSPVMKTSSNGDLWLENILKVGDGSTSTVNIGYNPSSAAADLHDTAHEVIKAGDSGTQFIVYEDGYMKATGGDFTGAIHASSGEFTGTVIATGGSIGGVAITQILDDLGNVVDRSKSIKINEPSAGGFVDNLPENIVLTTTITGLTSPTYKWYLNNVLISGATSSSYTIVNPGVSTSTNLIYKVEAIENEVTYSDYITINVSVSQDIPGFENYYYDIVTNTDLVQRYITNTGTLEWNVENIKFYVYKFINDTSELLNPSTLHFIYNGDDLNSISDFVQYINVTNNILTFDFQNLLTYEGTNTILINLIEDLTNENPTIIARFLINGQSVYEKNISFSNPITDSLAAFSVNAFSVNAAINNTALSFSEDGLVIENGGFTINRKYIEQYEEEGVQKEREVTESLLYYDNVAESLYIKGNGTFTGNIYANDGEFTGIVHATNGEFTGQITATSGSIGGFIINENQLVSTDNNESIKLNGTTGEIIAEKIILGSNATIRDYLKLGSAYIYNPDSEEKNNNLLISAGSDTLEEGYLKIYDTGYIDLGNIQLNSKESTIYLNNYYIKTLDNNPQENKNYYIRSGEKEPYTYTLFNGEEFQIGVDYYEFIVPRIVAGNNVIISPDRSRFNNVDITGTLHTSVFEVGQVQTVGGAMIFKEGAEIDTVEQNGTSYNFTTKTKINLKVGSVVAFTNSDNTTIYGTISEIGDNIYTTTTNIIDYTNVTQLADYENNAYTNNLVIGINSGSSMEKMLYPQALTMRTIIGYNNNEPIYTDKPTLVLGNLTNIIPSNSNIKGFGLYGQNVFLTGSLVTEFTSGQNISYAGVNTFNGVTAEVFDNVIGVTKDNSKIVFWGGALPSEYGGDLDKAIKNAPFQVTENGSFYAGQGYFKGAIITDAEIRAASLWAANIYGYVQHYVQTSDTECNPDKTYYTKDENQKYNKFEGQDFEEGVIYYEYIGEQAALNIHDTTNGIIFKDDNNTELLRINNTGFASNNNQTQFITIQNDKVNFTGDTFQGEIFKGNFEGNITTKKDEYNKYIGFEGPTVQGRQLTNDDSILLGYLTLDTKTILSNNKEKIELDSGAVNITADITSMSGDISFGSKMKYQKIIVNDELKGYDLYVS